MLYLLLAVPILLLLALSPASELVAMLRRRGVESPSARERAQGTPRLLFLIPAHNEEPLIGACVRSLRRMAYPEDARAVVVIADNCTDRTAAAAREAGGRCLERNDPGHPGKPRALAWALERLRAEGRDDWEACVVIDADTVVDPRFAARLARHAPLGEKCVQAYFDLSNERESWLTRLAAVLARVRYEHSYPLKRAAGLNAPLTGNGMCIGRELLADGWPAFSLTENWELYARFTADGVSIEYEREARLFSQEASSLPQANTQRRRWLAGRTWVLAHYLGALLRSSRIGVHQKLDAVGELAAPSPVLHGTAVVALLVPAPFLLPTWSAAALILVGLSTLLPLALHTLGVLRTHPDRWEIAGCFLFLPAYAMWRIVTAVLTLRTLRDGQWKKTKRA